MWEIHTYGNGAVLAMLFNGMRMWIASPEATALVHVIGVAGILFLAFSFLFTYEFKFLHWLVALTFVYFSSFVARYDVAVVDHLRPADTQVITGVPSLPAFIGHAFTVTGDVMTRITEQAFSLPPELHTRRSGYAASLQFARASLHEHLPEPFLSGSAAYYIKNCVFYDVLDGTKSADQILKSPHLLEDFEVVHPSRFTETLIAADGSRVLGHPDVVACTEGYQRLRAGLDAVYSTWWDRFTVKLSGSSGLPREEIEPVLVSSYQQLMNVAAGPQEILFQSAMIHAYDEAVELFAKATGNTEELLGMVLAQAEYQQTMSLWTSGQAAKGLLPHLRAMIEIFVFGIFIIILPFLFFPSAAVWVLKAWIISLLSLQLWGPVMALFNLGFTLWAEEAIRFLAQNGVTVMTLYALDPEIATKLAMAEWTAASVPVISVALASFAFSGGMNALASAIGASQSAGSSSASTAGMGNISMGNVNLSNLTANKYNPAVEETTGWREQQHGGMTPSGYAPARYAYVTPDGGAVQATLSNAGGGMALRLEDTESRMLQTAYGKTKQQAQEMFDSESVQFRETLGRQSEQHAAAQTEQSYGESFDQERSAQWQSIASAVDQVARQISDKTGVSASAAREIAEQALFSKSANVGGGLDASFGMGFGKSGLGIGLGGKVKVGGEKIDRESAEVQAQKQQAFDEAYNAFSEEQAREAWSLNEQVRSSEQARHSESAVAGERESAASGSSQESGRQHGLRETAAQLESLSHQLSRNQGRSVSLSQDQTAALINYISNQGRVPKGMVVQGIAEAAESGRLQTTSVGGKSVADWVREWQGKNPPLDGPEVAELSEKGSSLERSVESRIQNQSDIVPHEQSKIRSHVEDRQTGMRADIQSEKERMRGRVEEKKENVEGVRRGIETEVSSRKAEVSEKQTEVGRSGENQKDRVEKFQEKGVSLNRVTAEGLIGPFRDTTEGRVSQERKEVFPEGIGSPHPNFYSESRLEGLRKMQEVPEEKQELLEKQSKEMHKRLENVFKTIEKLDETKRKNEN